MPSLCKGGWHDEGVPEGLSLTRTAGLAERYPDALPSIAAFLRRCFSIRSIVGSHRTGLFSRNSAQIDTLSEKYLGKHISFVTNP